MFSKQFTDTDDASVLARVLVTSPNIRPSARAVAKSDLFQHL